MEAFKKQASKLREQVAKQQQAVLKQFSGRFGNDSGLADEADIQCHQQLQMLYSSTRAAKATPGDRSIDKIPADVTHKIIFVKQHFQRDIVRGVEGLISISSKQIGIVTKLAEDCCKYGNENLKSSSALVRASVHFGTSHSSMERERENLLRILGDQVFEPLRAMIMGAPLEDARHLTYRYERIRQDVEAQTIDVVKRQLKSREAGANADCVTKLQQAELKLSELRSNLSALGTEAISAMMSVEAQQQRVTFQQLLAMVDAERAYHQNVSAILDKLHATMVLEKQHTESDSQSEITTNDVNAQIAYEDAKLHQSGDLRAAGQKATYFIAEVIHPFDAQADGELSLSIGDYIVVRQVAQNGWSEGESQGKAGWFPSAYVEQRDKAPANKVI